MSQKAAFVALGILLLAAAAAARDAAAVVDVYDGDTITVRYESGETVKIRLIGIDTPEIADNPHGPASEYGPISRDYLDALLVNRRVELEYDVTATDKYGRTLAYVYLPGSIMVNERMLGAGYAQLLTVPPNVKYVDKFTAAQSEAIAGSRGLWGLQIAVEATGGAATGLKAGAGTAPAGPATPTEGGGFFVTETGKKFHKAGCRYLTSSAIPITREEAFARGYTPCSVCIGGTAKVAPASSSSSSGSSGRCEAITKKGTR